MPERVGYGERKPPGLIISLDFLTPNKRNSKSRKYGDIDKEDEEEERMSYAELARKRLAKKRKK